MQNSSALPRQCGNIYHSATIAMLNRWHASRYVRFGITLHDFARKSRASGD